MKKAGFLANWVRYSGILVIFLVVLGITLESSAQAPVANFTANVVSGCSPLIVNFTDQSSGNPTSWYWDLGNGSTSAIQNPTATYITPGSYTIVLTATNGSGSNTVTKTNYITVQVGPTVDFTSTNTAGCTPHTVSFTDLSTTSAGTITQWEWNFGDGGTSTVKNPTHTYTMSGTFNVLLKVTNSAGCSQTAFKQQYIKAGAGAQADFIANVPSFCQAPVTVTFSNTSQVDGAATYLWNFGDGNTSTDVNPSHIYNTVGSFTVTLTVQSADGCNNSKQQVIDLSGKNVSFSGPNTLCVGAAANFTMTSSPTPLSQSWNMGDGTAYATPTVTHTYNSPGTYTITLSNEFSGGCISTTSQTVTVVPGPSIDFTADTTKSCKAPFTVAFQTSTSSGGYLWDFGDGNTSTQQNPTHTYQVTGTFAVSLTATNTTGCTSTITKNDFVLIQPPVAAISNVPVNDGCTPYSFSPTANITAPDGVASYFWDFGNGFTSTSPTPTYTYTTPGSYTMTLRIVTRGGCADTVVYPNAVNISTGQNVDFTAVPLTACVGQSIQFNMTTSGSPTSYQWLFGDGTNSTALSPSHAYNSAQSYTVTLLVAYGSCTSKVTKTNYINIEPPEAKFSANRDCNNSKLIHFTDESVGTGNMLWNFGDGNTSTAQNPSHPYAADGTYTVSLTVDNGTCTHTITKDVEVSSAPIDFTASVTTVCKGATIRLKAIIPNTITPTRYEWIVPNYTTVNTTVDSLDWVFYQSGVFDMTLKIYYLNCEEAVTKTGYFTVYGPTADFKVDKLGGCINTTINFTDSSTTDGWHSLTNWQWDFGDQSPPASGQSVSHTYPVTGKYTITLKVTDNSGCSDTRVKTDFINITNGKARFSAADSMSCRGRTVIFRDSSTGNVSTWQWTFGDGGAINGVQNPAHVYADSGSYTVKLKIIETSGCVDSITKVNYVTIKDPKAGFTLSDTFSTCPPLSVNFYDHSYYVRKWSWDFDDGGSSPIQHPVNLYNIPDTYRVKLTVTSPGGCTDSAFATIRILGPYGTFDYTPLTGCTPLATTYSVTSATAIKFLWDYSDGIVDSGTVSTSSHTYMTGGRFVPKVILTDPAGCRVPVVGKDTIFIEKSIVDFEPSSISFCDTANVDFANNTTVNSPNVTYQWLYGNGNTGNTVNGNNTYLAAGTYDVTLIATTPLGCKDTMTKEALIRVHTSPVVSIVSDDTLCEPASFNFTAQLQADTSSISIWNWSFGNGQSSNAENPPVQLFATAGTYTNTLSLQDSEGCTSVATKTIVVLPLPPLEVVGDTIICKGGSAQLNATGAISYSWITPNEHLSCTNCADPVATPEFDIMYVVAGNAANGCIAYDSVLVRVFQPYQITVDPASDSICFGKSVQLKANGAQIYSWSPSDGLSNPNISNPIASPTFTTTYTVVATDSLSCFGDSLSIPITVLPLPTVDVGPDITVSAGTSVNLTSVASADVVSYMWTPPTGLSCTTCPNPVMIAGSNLTYSLRVMNNYGCTAQDQLNVTVTCNEGNFYVPNTFTPNGDGMNDVFYIRGSGVYAIKSFRVFNRWGELMFERKEFVPNDPSQGWNGMYKGAKASSDTYVYQVEVLCTNNQVLKFNGTISLIL